MGKKYSPSGYQIINLGSLNLNDNVTIHKGENADADVLISLMVEGKLGNKPILLKLRDTDSGTQLIGFPVLDNENSVMILVNPADVNIHVTITNESVIVGHMA